MTDGISVRLDCELVRRGLARGRGEAQSLVQCGQVLVGGIVAGKPSLPVAETDRIEVQGERCPYVSRGGQKLAAALAEFGIPVERRTALDVGASTGGFSDCLLQAGAATVHAIDVGHGQLHPSLAQEPRLQSQEGISVRALTPDNFPALFDMIVADLSFISLSIALPVMARLIKPDGDMVCLVKPQFEVGRKHLGKGGVVRDETLRQAALTRVRDAALHCGLKAAGCMTSPIAGRDGNIEYLLWLQVSAGKDASDE